MHSEWKGILSDTENTEAGAIGGKRSRRQALRSTSFKSITFPVIINKIKFFEHS